MSAPSKEKLLEKAASYGLDIPADAKAGDIKKAIDAHEASLNATDAAKVEQTKPEARSNTGVHIVKAGFRDKYNGVHYSIGTVLPHNDQFGPDRIKDLKAKGLI